MDLLKSAGVPRALSCLLDFDMRKEDDHPFDIEGFSVYIDPQSYLYPQGVTLDYADELQDNGFKFVHPNANKTCACGESFST